MFNFQLKMLIIDYFILLTSRSSAISEEALEDSIKLAQMKAKKAR